MQEEVIDIEEAAGSEAIEVSTSLANFKVIPTVENMCSTN